MAKDKLTESVVKEANPIAKQFKLSDGEGLYLLVHSNGSKYWRFDFRFEGRQKSSSLGVWPEVSLAEARLRRNQAKIKIRDGVNPIQEKKEKTALQLEEARNKEKSELACKEIQKLGFRVTGTDIVNAYWFETNTDNNTFSFKATNDMAPNVYLNISHSLYFFAKVHPYVVNYIIA